MPICTRSLGRRTISGRAGLVIFSRASSRGSPWTTATWTVAVAARRLSTLGRRSSRRPPPGRAGAPRAARARSAAAAPPPRSRSSARRAERGPRGVRARPRVAARRPEWQPRGLRRRDRRRRFLGLVRDRQALCHARQVGIHLAAVLVAVLRILRQRRRTTEIELVRHLADPGGLSSEGVPGRCSGASWRSQRRVARERDRAREHLGRARRRPSRGRTSGCTGLPCACSGERYWAVPMIDPASVIWLIADRAMPKSVTFRRPSGATTTLCGLDVAVDDAVAVRKVERRQDLARVVDGHPHRRRAPETISSLRVLPSRYSIAMIVPRSRRGRRSRRCRVRERRGALGLATNRSTNWWSFACRSSRS